MIGYIYYLKEKGDIFYVGCTVNPYTRIQNHNRNFDSHPDKYGISKLKKHFNSRLEMEVIEEIEFTDYKDLLKIENYWINQFVAWGFELINKSYLRVNKPLKKLYPTDETLIKHIPQEKLINLGWI
jgi:predicted GIY-YIG superfamily endonuclease